MELTVATYNVQHCRNFAHFLQTGEEVIDAAAVSAILLANGVEICALNEIFVQPEGKLGDQPRDIAAPLGYHHVFGVGTYFGKTPYGNAVVSAYPVEETRQTRICIPKSERKYTGYYEDRVLLEADLCVGDRKITFMTCHFGLMRDEMEAAAETVLAALKKAPYPVILTGDFNMTPDDAIIARLREALTDLVPADGAPQFTFRSDRPDRKIDYIMIGREWSCRRVYVPQTLVSDHLPLVAQLTLA